MKRKLLIIPFFVIFVLICSGCVETRVKEVTTDADGGGEATAVITQSAKFTPSTYEGARLNCGSQITIQISISNRNDVKDNFIFVDKGKIAENMKPINVRSGDQVRIKITNGCPSTKYMISYLLDSGD